MEIGTRIHQLRKLSGMTQEQLAEKLNVSRQTVSKWESGGTTPDLDSVVRMSRLFELSLDDFLMDEAVAHPEGGKITLEDLMKINRHNRNMTLLLMSGLIFLMIGILNLTYVLALRSTTVSIQYMLYRYITVGEYAYAPVNYELMMFPALGAGVIGILLCVCYVVKSMKKSGGR